MTAQNICHSTAAGIWSGRYWYLHIQPENGLIVPFSAFISETDGMLSGTTLEPNSFVENGMMELSAALSGMREDGIVEFVKVYDSAPDVHDMPIIYEGEMDSDGMRIFGGWTLESDDGAFAGGFELVRASHASSMTRAAALAL